MRRKPVIAIIGTGNESEPAVSQARELGRLIAEQGWILVTGGRNGGVMRSANEGAKEAKDSLTIGILPGQDSEVADAIDVAIFTDLGEARNNLIVLSADVVIASGVDDPGTASEVSLAIKNGKHVVLLNVSEDAKMFFGRIGRDHIRSVESAEEAIGIVAGHLAERYSKF